MRHTLDKRFQTYDLGDGRYDNSVDFPELYDHFERFSNMVAECGSSSEPSVHLLGDHILLQYNSWGVRNRDMCYRFFSRVSYDKYVAYAQQRQRTEKIDKLLK
jgi:hypothetical protein